MIDDGLDIVTPDGMMNTLVTHPEEGGPHPVVLFYMDAAGKREELHDMARRIGTASYYVMLPNLYHRDERDFDATVDMVAAGKRMAELGSTLDYAKIAIDTQAMPAHGGVDPAARSDRVGAVGYCMSGRFAYAAVGIFPDRIRAAASIYGVRLHGEHHRRGVLRVRGAGRERAEGDGRRA